MGLKGVINWPTMVSLFISNCEIVRRMKIHWYCFYNCFAVSDFPVSDLTVRHLHMRSSVSFLNVKKAEK